MFNLEYIRHFRIFEYAIFDLVISFIGIYLLSALLTKLFRKISIDIPKINWIFLTLPIGIIVHLLVGQITPMTKYFIDIHGHYLLKLFVLVLLFFGLRGVRFIKK